MKNKESFIYILLQIYVIDSTQDDYEEDGKVSINPNSMNEFTFE